MPTLGFSTGPPSKPAGKGDGIGSAIGAIVGAVTGSGSGCGTGAGGFKPGNQCGAKHNRNQHLADLQKAHTRARARAQGFARRGTSLSDKGRQALADAARAHELLGQARKAHGSAKVAARREKAAATKAIRSTKAVHNLLAGRAADKIADLRSKAQSGNHQIVDTLAGLHRAARSTNKAELFTAAKLLGINHTATTKGGLTDHLAAHLISGGKARPNQHSQDPSEHTDHAPGHVGYLNTNLISVDADRFQFKAGSAAGTGSVGSLAGVQKFNHNLAGITQVWKDPHDGKTYIINGHNRLDLARKLGEDKLTVRFIQAEDAAEARAIGAASNIAEGRGTAIDAAKFFAQRGLDRHAIEREGITLRDKLANDGLALSKLDKGLFTRVVDGNLTTEKGAIIGAADLTHPQQRELAKLIDEQGKKRGGEITNNHLKELIDHAKAAPTVQKKTTSLFGDDVEEKSLLLHRSKLASQVKDKLSKEKKLFGIVARGTNAENLARGGNQINAEQSSQISHEAGTALATFDALKHRSGPIAQALNHGAERIHAGEDPRKVQKDVYARILEAVKQEIQ